MAWLPLFALGAMLMEAGMGRAKGAFHCFVKGFIALAVGFLLGSVGANEQGALWCALAALLATIGLSDRITLAGTVGLAVIVSLAHRVVTLLDRLISLAGTVSVPASLAGLAGVRDWLVPFWQSDYAGVWAVHTLAGGAALGALAVVGPRVGRYTKNGLPAPMPPHNLPLAGLGVFFLWVGAQGFSQPLWLGASQAGFVAFLTALLWTKWRFGKADPSFAFSAFWAGLVAGLAVGTAAWFPLAVAGALSGVSTVALSIALDRRFIDDPVGVVTAEGVAPLIGLLALWFTGNAAFGLGAISWVVAFLGGWAAARVVCRGMALAGLLRLAPMDEFVGVDQRLYGIAAYPEFELREA